MNIKRFKLPKLNWLFALLTATLLSSCASVPKEVVELSYITGKDIQSIQSSYTTMITQFYDGLRDQRRDYLDNKWFPRFLHNWRDDGRLIDVVKGNVIYSEERNDFIPTPPGTSEQQKFQNLSDWVNEAIFAYERKEQELFSPLNEEEAQLLVQVNESFERLIRANATVTAHLNSLNQLQQAQDEAFAALGIENIRNEITVTLSNASKRAKEALDKIEEADIPAPFLSN